MNYFLEYLRYPLAALLTVGLALWLGVKAARARRDRDRLRYSGVALVVALLAGRALLDTGLILMIGPPPSVDRLIAALETEVGVQLPASAEVTSYRQVDNFFGEWGGLLKAEVPCPAIAPLRRVSGTLLNSQTPFEIRDRNTPALFDAWRKSRFTIPAGAQIIQRSQANIRVVYGVDAESCTVHFQRYEI